MGQFLRHICYCGVEAHTCHGVCVCIEVRGHGVGPSPVLFRGFHRLNSSHQHYSASISSTKPSHRPKTEEFHCLSNSCMWTSSHQSCHAASTMQAGLRSLLSRMLALNHPECPQSHGALLPNAAPSCFPSSNSQKHFTREQS